MGLVTGIVVYLLIWWTVLFATLPVGVQPDAEGEGPGGWRGAPQAPNLLRKALWTTLISLALWGALEAVVRSDYLSFRAGWLAMPEH